MLSAVEMDEWPWEQERQAMTTVLVTQVVYGVEVGPGTSLHKVQSHAEVNAFLH